MSFAFFMDLGLLVLLAATVVLVFKLNINLKHFKESRFEMEGLVNRLTANVERAEKAIAGLQVSARNSGADIDKKIKESKFLSDELKFMNDAGNNLADRLEKLAETNRALIEKMQESGGVGPTTSQAGSNIYLGEKQTPRPAAQTHATYSEEDDATPSFSIADREFSHPSDVLDEMDALDLELEAHSASAGFQSQAERELFQALQKRKMAGGRA